MTDNIIQQARDVLAKWRSRFNQNAWYETEDIVGETCIADPEGGYIARDLASTDARLIVGTAGNPDLLDALDKMLEMWADWARHGYVYVPEYVERIAAAIITADERMTP